MHNAFMVHYKRGAPWCSWLSHCAISHKVAGSIPSGVTEIFHSPNPFWGIMALAPTPPLKEMSTINISWGVKAACSHS